jgi:phage replication O-like protein O
MANPQVEDGHVDIANEIVEALARIRLSGEEMQILWVVFRKTYGWHKKTDTISLGQFSEATGLSRPHVVRAIKKLLPKMVLRVTKNGNSTVNTFEFNKDFEEWKVLPKKGTVTKNGNRVLPKMGTKVLPKMVHTKEKKETRQKKEGKPSAYPFDDIVDAYHKNLPNLTHVAKLSDKRKAYIKARWNEDKDRQNIEWWDDFFAYCARCKPIANGTTFNDGHQWHADFEWIVTEGNFIKIIEGKYE